MEQALFWLFSVAAIGSAVGVVLNVRNTVSAAVCLVVTMLSLACLFVMLGAQFVGLIQVMVYAGAIVVLFLFVIMLLNLKPEGMGAELHPILKALAVAVSAGVALQVGSILSTLNASWSEVPDTWGTTRSIGEVLYTDFLLPFEVAGILLLAGIVGAIVLSKRSLE
jgi:NADH-quinone oxidoreductase subunit J